MRLLIEPNFQPLNKFVKNKLFKNIISVLFVLFFSLCVSTSCYSSHLNEDTTLVKFPEKTSFNLLLNRIKQAKHSIEIVTYSFTNKTIAYALLNRAKQGVKIKILIEQKPYKAEKINNNIITLLRKNKNIEIKHRHLNKGYLHQKTLIIDHKLVAILTLNFTNSGLFHQRNFMYVTRNKTITKQADALFSHDWQHKKFHPEKSTDLVISPVNSAKKIIALLNSAHNEIEIYAAGLSDKQIISKLTELAKHKKIEIILAEPNNKNIVRQLCNSNIALHYFKYKNQRQHSKAILVNADSLTNNSSAYIGSANFTFTSLHKNRELGIITSNKKVTTTLKSSFDTDWNKNSINACS